MERRLNSEGHPAAIAWRKLAGSAATPDEVISLEREWKKKKARPVYRLRRRGHPSFRVVAKPCTPDEARRTITFYRDVLADLDVTIPRPLGSIASGDDDETWLFIEEVGGEEYQPADVLHRRLAGRWLGILHTQASIAPRQSPSADFDYLYDTDSQRIAEHLTTALRLSLAILSVSSKLRGHHRRTLQSISEHCELLDEHWPALQRFSRSQPRTLVHGDFCVSNMLVGGDTQRPELIVFDWQRAGWASPAFDLTRFLGSWVAPDLAAYLEVTQRFWPHFDAALALRLAYVGEILRWVEAVRWDVERLQYEWVEEPLNRLQVYDRWMNDIRVAAPWSENGSAKTHSWSSVVPYERPRGLAPKASVHC